MIKINIGFLHEDTLEVLGVVAMVAVPRKGDDVRLIKLEENVLHEIYGTVSFVQWTVQYDTLGNPSEQDVEIHLSVHKEEHNDE